MPTALVTGPAASAGDVADVLRTSGFEPVCADYGLPLAEVATSVPLSSIACYVQLPREDTGNLDENRRSGVAPTPFSSFDTLGLVARHLTADATAVLVVEDSGEAALFGVLAGAVLADHGAGGVITKVVDEDTLHAAIADFAECRSPVLSVTTDYWVG